jgi:hypothetical protein
MTNHLIIHEAGYETVRAFLDSPKILLLTCNTHVDPNIGYHDKVIGLPLGVKTGGKLLYANMRALSGPRRNGTGLRKKRVLLVNNSGWQDRKKINAQVRNQGMRNE